jgi:CRISPR/Cas system-associated endonuclease Cas3-HD
LKRIERDRRGLERIERDSTELERIERDRRGLERIEREWAFITWRKWVREEVKRRQKHGRKCCSSTLAFVRVPHTRKYLYTLLKKIPRAKFKKGLFMKNSQRIKT